MAQEWHTNESWQMHKSFNKYVMAQEWHTNASCQIHESSKKYVMAQEWHTNESGMGWLRLVGSLKLQVSFAKEPYKRDDILQKRPII